MTASVGGETQPMYRIVASTWFLVSTAVCCGVAVAFTSWIAEDSADGVRLLAALLGLGAGLAVMLLVAWALAGEHSPPAAAAASAPVLEPTPVTAAAPEPAARADARDALTRRVDEGRTLREELAPGASDARVAYWIESARETVERQKPGVAGYFDALATRPYADDAERLDAYVRRLETIVRDFL
jgi:hypothetical protein